MEELTKRKDIIITNADKGGAVVIMDVEKCIYKANRQLSDKRNYKLQKDPTLQHSNLVNDTIDRFKKENLLSNKPTDRRTEIHQPKNPKILHFTQDTKRKQPRKTSDKLN